MITFDCIIPIYNAQNTIRRAISSALNQSYAFNRIICIDDGSTDASYRAADNMLAETSAQTVLLRQNNCGANIARNRGLHQSSSDYIVFLDADDELEPERLNRCVRTLSRYQSRSVICGGYRRISLNGDVYQQLPGTGSDELNLLTSRSGITSANVWNRQDLIAVGGWNATASSSQEYRLMFDLMQNGGTFAYEYEYQATLYAQTDSITSKPGVLLNWLQLRAEILEWIQRTGKDIELKDAEQHMFKQLRRLAQRDLAAASDLFGRIITADFLPEADGFTTRPYLAAYQIGGFEFAERLARLARLLRRRTAA